MGKPVVTLKLPKTVRDGSFYGSLLWAIDRTCTAMGSRALRRWLLQPLLDSGGICAVKILSKS
jgi:DNA mismatch repair protein MutS